MILVSPSMVSAILTRIGWHMLELGLGLFGVPKVSKKGI